MTNKLIFSAIGAMIATGNSADAQEAAQTQQKPNIIYITVSYTHLTLPTKLEV